MKFTVDFGDVGAAFDGVFDDLEIDATKEADRVQRGLTLELRQQVLAAGMGQRLANTWRGKRYPIGKPSLGATAFVWSKAAAIVDAFGRGAVIRPINGKRYLAIPTENVPRKGGARGSSRLMTPEEVESSFNQDLKFFRTPKGTIVAYVQAIGAASGKGFRKPTKGRSSQGRTAQSVVMFYLVPTVRLPKRFDIDGAAQHWADEFVNDLRELWSTA